MPQQKSALLPPAFILGSAAGSIGYVLLTYTTKCLCRRLSPKTTERIETLGDKRRSEFFSYGPSTVHSILQTIGTHGFLPVLSADPVRRFDDDLYVEYGFTGLGPAFYMGLFVGYLLADLFFIGPANLGGLMTGHHIAASVDWTMVSANRSMQWYASFLQRNELSTIFVNLRQVLLTVGYDSSSREVTMAGLAMFFAFGWVRALPLPKLAYDWMMRDALALYEKDGLAVAMFQSAFVLFHVLMQGYWFGLMAKKFVALVLGRFHGKNENDAKKKKE